MAKVAKNPKKDWESIFKRYETFEGTNKAFCEQENISKDSFYAYKKIYHKATSQNIVPKLHKVQMDVKDIKEVNTHEKLLTPLTSQCIVDINDVKITFINPTKEIVSNLLDKVTQYV